MVTTMADGTQRAYYNEFDKAAAQRLRSLIAAGLIPAGDVDERSIEDVTPADLAGYTQHHFFAGIGGWPLSLRLAGWPDSRPAWTGSCPCQPFSAAGKGAGFADERHLWPAWQHLIAQCRPAVVFGEQVASAAVGPWIDLVHADLEGMGYAFGCLPFPAAGVGAPHIRDRTYWVADTGGTGLSQRGSDGRVQREALGASTREAVDGCGDAGRLADATASGRREERAVAGRRDERDSTQGGAAGFEHGGSGRRPGPLHGFWRGSDWLLCTDGRWRPVEPGTFPLAHGLPAGLGKLSPELRRLAEVAGLDAASLRRAKGYRIECLKGYGNAIVPQQAALFVEAYMACRDSISAREAVAA